jgi:HAD superfamily hydrolase (TIGR01509 family)
MMARGAVPLRSGVERLLREGRDAGLRLAIATTTTPANVTALLDSTLGSAATGWFEVIGAAPDAARKKPAPDIYINVLGRLGVTARDCIAFEDSANGVRAARGAGLPVIVTPSEFTGGEDFDGAALVIDRMGEPAAPFRVLAGSAPGHACLDLALVRELHRRTGA